MSSRSPVSFLIQRYQASRPWSATRTIASTALAVLLATGTSASANPADFRVIAGEVGVADNGAGTLSIKNSSGAVIHWNTFNIGAGEVTSFTQSGATSRVLNRVVGGGRSEILGSLTSNGRVYVINPNGIVVGSGASVDTAGLVMSSLALSDADWKSGVDRFSGTGGGAVVNQGRLSSSGRIVLASRQVQNSGTISANGDIVLAAGEKLALGTDGLDFVNFEVSSASGEIINTGVLSASKGAAGLFAARIRSTGSIRATGVSTDHTGSIQLVGNASATVSGGLSADTDLRIDSGDVTVSGGTTVLRGRNIDLKAVRTASVVSAGSGNVQLRASGDLAVNAQTINVQSGVSGSVILKSGSALEIRSIGDTRVTSAGGAGVQLVGETVSSSARNLALSSAATGSLAVTGQSSVALQASTSLDVVGPADSVRVAAASGDVTATAPTCSRCDELTNPDPVDPVDPIDPIDPVDPVDPINPVVSPRLEPIVAPLTVVVNPGQFPQRNAVLSASTNSVTQLFFNDVLTDQAGRPDSVGTIALALASQLPACR